MAPTSAQTTVTYRGTTYTLQSEAQLSNRVFPGWWGDANDGEEYTAEWAADAVDESGDWWRVVWRWTETRGDELEDASDYDWSDANIANVIRV